MTGASDLFQFKTAYYLILLIAHRYKSVSDMCLDLFIQNVDKVAQKLNSFLICFIMCYFLVSGFFSEKPQRRCGIRRQIELLWMIYSCSWNIFKHKPRVLSIWSFYYIIFIYFILFVCFPFRIGWRLYLLLRMERQRVPICTIEVDAWVSIEFFFFNMYILVIIL